MTEFLITMAVFAAFALLFVLVWLIIEAYYGIKDHFRKKAWNAALEAHPHLRELVDEAQALYDDYQRKFKIMYDFQEKVDRILNAYDFEYLPYQERIAKEEEAERLKVARMKAKYESDLACRAWREKCAERADYCRENNLKFFRDNS